MELLILIPLFFTLFGILQAILTLDIGFLLFVFVVGWFTITMRRNAPVSKGDR